MQKGLASNVILAEAEGQIVYDSFLTTFNMHFGPGIRRRLNESYKEAKAWYGIVTSLPMLAEKPQPAKQITPTKKRATRGRVKGGGSRPAGGALGP
jgi:hypothetical protein